MSKEIKLTEGEIQKIQQLILEWGRENYQEFPWRSTDAPFHGLIAEILLQRTRAENVVPVYREFVERFPTPDKLAAATVKEIEEVIHPLGLHWRAPLLSELGEVLANRDTFPDTVEGLKELPGVGPYTANAWVSFHGDERGVLVDANVVRLICRLVGRDWDGETRRKKWLREMADLLTPDEKVGDFNYALLDFTMTVCTPGSPHCDRCPLGAEVCQYRREVLAAKKEGK